MAFTFLNVSLRTLLSRVQEMVQALRYRIASHPGFKSIVYSFRALPQRGTKKGKLERVEFCGRKKKVTCAERRDMSAMSFLISSTKQNSSFSNHKGLFNTKQCSLLWRFLNARAKPENIGLARLFIKNQI